MKRKVTEYKCQIYSYFSVGTKSKVSKKKKTPHNILSYHNTETTVFCRIKVICNSNSASPRVSCVFY